MGKEDVRVQRVDDPRIEQPTDALLRVTLTAICGSDLHLYRGWNPTMKKGDVLGHEFMGEVVATGSGVTKLKKGDRVVTSFAISCGACWFCERELFSCCDTTNPSAKEAEKLYGASGAGLFGYSHLFGGFPGGQAEYVRVPHADVGCLVLPERFHDDKAQEKVLFLGDILSTAWMAAENCGITKGDTVVVWGCGPVGLLSITCARAMGAGRIIAVDQVPERLAMARSREGAGADVVLDFRETEDVVEAIRELTSGRGPDSCIEAVGMDADAKGLIDAYDKTKQVLRLESDRPQALRLAFQSCRKAGTVSIPGVYSGSIDKLNFGSAFSKGLTLKMGQTHVQRYMAPLLARIETGEIDASYIITHRTTLEDAPEMYRTFNDRKDGCVKVVMRP
jgi:threonine dehydrogenase-like Zn-dependent dehydrogenase